MNWFPVGKDGANKIYVSKEHCEAEEGQACYDITGKDLRYHELVSHPQLDGDGNQMYAQDPVLDGDGNSVLDGDGNPTYTQGAALTYNTLEENAGLKASVEADDAALSGSEAAIEVKLKNMEFGKRVLAIVSIRNDAKSLQPADVVSLSNTYAPIQGLLLNGSIATAKAQIEAITPDGVLVSQDDLDAILAEINAYLGV